MPEVPWWVWLVLVIVLLYVWAQWTQTLRPCPDCGHQVSQKAYTCPSCGRTLKQPPTYGCAQILLGVLFMAIALFILAAILGLPK